MIDRQEWLAERRLGIGGSDIASVFNLGYGCRRRLWYDKRNTPEDFPREDTAAMELGRYLEPWFADKYAKETGRHVVAQANPFIHRQVPELRVNVDRTISDNSRPGWPGVLEIKSVGRAVFYKIKREGLPEDYILQLQHGMLVVGLKWGSFAIGNRDSGELLYWDVEASAALESEILIEGPKFWALVENGPIPDALEPDDKRCQSCSWRRTCQGNALAPPSGDVTQAPELLPLLAEYDERKSLFEQAESLLEESKEVIKTTLGSRDAVEALGRKVYYRTQDGRVTWDGKGLAEAVSKFTSDILVKLVNGTLTVDDVVNTAPVAQNFKKQGNPFKALRIY